MCAVSRLAVRLLLALRNTVSPMTRSERSRRAFAETRAEEAGHGLQVQPPCAAITDIGVQH